MPVAGDRHRAEVGVEREIAGCAGRDDQPAEVGRRVARQLQTKMKKTIIFITHDLSEAIKLGDRIAIMKDGEIVQVGTSEEILTEPANEYVNRNYICRICCRYRCMYIRSY